jgi:hypothetical protein
MTGGQWTTQRERRQTRDDAREASKIGASRWNLETLPGLVKSQEKLRLAEQFEAVLKRAEVSHQTLTTDQVLAGFPQNQPVENNKRRRADSGKARKRPRQTA